MATAMVPGSRAKARFKGSSRVRLGSVPSARSRRRRQQAAEQERQPPRPGFELRFAGEGDGGGGGRGGQQHARCGTDIRHATGEAAPSGRRGLDQIGDRAGVFAADREALEQSHQEQQHRRADAGRFIGRQQRDRGRADAHQRHRQQQHEAPSNAVADGSKNRSTNRPHREADREAAIGADQRRERIVGREEQPRQHRREIAVETEIVPFEQIADAARGQRRRRESRAIANFMRFRLLSARRHGNASDAMGTVVWPWLASSESPATKSIPRTVRPLSSSEMKIAPRSLGRRPVLRVDKL
jgi:hypothetical protein